MAATVVHGITVNGDTSKALRQDGSWGETWPVGSIFLSAVATNPATLLGFGTWAAIAAGRVLVGVDVSQVEFDELGETGGTKTHTLTTTEIPAHAHVEQAQGGTTASNSGTHVMTSTATGGSLRSVETSASAGGGGAHNNLQPYLVVSIWQRTA